MQFDKSTMLLQLFRDSEFMPESFLVRLKDFIG